MSIKEFYRHISILHLISDIFDNQFLVLVYSQDRQEWVVHGPVATMHFYPCGWSRIPLASTIELVGRCKSSRDSLFAIGAERMHANDQLVGLSGDSGSTEHLKWRSRREAGEQCSTCHDESGCLQLFYGLSARPILYSAVCN